MTNLVQSKLVKTEIQASFPYLIEIWQKNDTAKKNCYRYANSSSDKIFENNVFAAAYFKCTPPEKTDSGVKDAKITISNIDMEWIEKIRDFNADSDRYSIRFVAVIDYDDNGEEYIETLDDITFTLANADWNESTIEWTMKFDEWLDIKLPCQKFTQFVAPALF